MCVTIWGSADANAADDPLLISSEPPESVMTATISYRGPLAFPAPPLHPQTRHLQPPPGVAAHVAPPQGTFYVLLCDDTLHLHRGDPFLTGDGEEDGAEIARVRMRDRWNVARRGKGDTASIWTVELSREEEVGSSGERRWGRIISRKRSTPTLARVPEVTEVAGKMRFADKFRMKRTKSISTGVGIIPTIAGETDRSIDGVDTLVMRAESSEAADRWVDKINLAISNGLPPTQSSARSPLSPSPSLPVLSSLVNHPRIATGAPAGRQMAPPAFNPARRPSFLDRLPPSPRSYVTVTSPSPIKERAEPTAGPSSNVVPAWIQSVQASSSSVPLGLKPKRSLSSLPSSASLMSLASLSMQRSKSDGRPSGDSSGDGGSESSSRSRLMGFLGKRPSTSSSISAPKKEKEVSELHTMLSTFSMAPAPSPSPSSHEFPRAAIYNDGTKSTSSTISLADSLSESVSTSAASSDVPLTPDLLLAAAKEAASKTTFNRPSSVLSSDMPKPPTSYRSRAGASMSREASETGSTSSRSPYIGSSEFDATESVGMSARGSLAEGESIKGSFSRRTASSFSEPSRKGSASSSYDHSTTIGSLRSSTPLASPSVHIVNPADLAQQMKVEVGRLSSSTSRVNNGRLGSSQGFGASTPRQFGGLSPPPRIPSRQNLSSLANSRSHSKQSLASYSLTGSASTRVGLSSLVEHDRSPAGSDSNPHGASKTLPSSSSSSSSTTSVRTPIGRRSSFGLLHSPSSREFEEGGSTESGPTTPTRRATLSGDGNWRDKTPTLVVGDREWTSQTPVRRS